MAIGAKNDRSIWSDGEESLWSLRTGPDIPLSILKPIFAGELNHIIWFNQEVKKWCYYCLGCSRSCSFRCHIYKNFKPQWKLWVFLLEQHTLQPYRSLLCSAHCKQFYLLHLLFTLCWAEWVDLKGYLGQPLLSKTQEITFKKNKTVVSCVMNPKIPLFTFLLFIHEHHRVLTFQIYKNIAHSWLH